MTESIDYLHHLILISKTADGLFEIDDTKPCVGYFRKFIIDMCHKINLVLQQDSVFQYMGSQMNLLSLWSQDYQYDESSLQKFVDITKQYYQDLVHRSEKQTKSYIYDIEQTIIALQMILICGYTKKNAFEFYQYLCNSIVFCDIIAKKVFQDVPTTVHDQLQVICHINYIKSQAYLLLPSSLYESIQISDEFTFENITKENTFRNLLTKEHCSNYVEDSLCLKELQHYKYKIMNNSSLPSIVFLRDVKKVLDIDTQQFLLQTKDFSKHNSISSLDQDITNNNNNLGLIESEEETTVDPYANGITLETLFNTNSCSLLTDIEAINISNPVFNKSDSISSNTLLVSTSNVIPLSSLSSSSSFSNDTFHKLPEQPKQILISTMKNPIHSSLPNNISPYQNESMLSSSLPSIASPSPTTTNNQPSLHKHNDSYENSSIFIHSESLPPSPSIHTTIHKSVILNNINDNKNNKKNNDNNYNNNNNKKNNDNNSMNNDSISNTSMSIEYSSIPQSTIHFSKENNHSSSDDPSFFESSDNSSNSDTSDTSDNNSDKNDEDSDDDNDVYDMNDNPFECIPPPPPPPPSTSTDNNNDNNNNKKNTKDKKKQKSVSKDDSSSDDDSYSDDSYSDDSYSDDSYSDDSYYDSYSDDSYSDSSSESENDKDNKHKSISNTKKSNKSKSTSKKDIIDNSEDSDSFDYDNESRFFEDAPPPPPPPPPSLNVPSVPTKNDINFNNDNNNTMKKNKEKITSHNKELLSTDTDTSSNDSSDSDNSDHDNNSDDSDNNSDYSNSYTNDKEDSNSDDVYDMNDNPFECIPPPPPPPPPCSSSKDSMKKSTTNEDTINNSILSKEHQVELNNNQSQSSCKKIDSIQEISISSNTSLDNLDSKETTSDDSNEESDSDNSYDSIVQHAYDDINETSDDDNDVYDMNDNPFECIPPPPPPPPPSTSTDNIINNNNIDDNNNINNNNNIDDNNNSNNNINDNNNNTIPLPPPPATNKTINNNSNDSQLLSNDSTSIDTNNSTSLSSSQVDNIPNSNIHNNILLSSSSVYSQSSINSSVETGQQIKEEEIVLKKSVSEREEKKKHRKHHHNEKEDITISKENDIPLASPTTPIDNSKSSIKEEKKEKKVKKLKFNSKKAPKEVKVSKVEYNMNDLLETIGPQELMGVDLSASFLSNINEDGAFTEYQNEQKKILLEKEKKKIEEEQKKREEEKKKRESLPNSHESIASTSHHTVSSLVSSYNNEQSSNTSLRDSLNSRHSTNSIHSNYQESQNINYYTNPIPIPSQEIISDTLSTTSSHSITHQSSSNHSTIPAAIPIQPQGIPIQQQGVSIQQQAIPIQPQGIPIQSNPIQQTIPIGISTNNPIQQTIPIGISTNNPIQSTLSSKLPQRNSISNQTISNTNNQSNSYNNHIPLAVPLTTTSSSTTNNTSSSIYHKSTGSMQAIPVQTMNSHMTSLSSNQIPKESISTAIPIHSHEGSFEINTIQNQNYMSDTNSLKRLSIEKPSSSSIEYGIPIQPQSTTTTKRPLPTTIPSIPVFINNNTINPHEYQQNTYINNPMSSPPPMYSNSQSNNEYSSYNNNIPAQPYSSSTIPSIPSYTSSINRNQIQSTSNNNSNYMSYYQTSSTMTNPPYNQHYSTGNTTMNPQYTTNLSQPNYSNQSNNTINMNIVNPYGNDNSNYSGISLQNNIIMNATIPVDRSFFDNISYQTLLQSIQEIHNYCESIRYSNPQNARAALTKAVQFVDCVCYATCYNTQEEQQLLIEQSSMRTLYKAIGKEMKRK
ncbi:hypothetical protein WA158_002826 [Blastocystis sp. Blastoise]